MPHFHNPYNFVRTPNRTEEVLEDPFAGEHDPSKPEFRENHSRYWSERYTGVIPVRLRTQTPLFITNPETRRKMERDQEKEEGAVTAEKLFTAPSANCSTPFRA